MERPADLGSLKSRSETAAPSPSSAKDRVSAYQELNKIKKGLKKSLIVEFEKRKVTNVEDAARVAKALRTKRVKSHKIAKPTAVKRPKMKSKARTSKGMELTRPGGSAAHKAIAAMKRALDSGIVKL